MPTQLFGADISFPSFSREQSTDEKLDATLDYLYLLLEKLRYSMSNIGVENFNESALSGIAKTISDPLSAKISDTEANVLSLSLRADGLFSQIESIGGNVSSLMQTADSLSSRITGLDGDVSTLMQTANSLSSRITSLDGNVSSLMQSSSSLSSRISNAEGSISRLSQTINGISLSVQTSNGISSIKLVSNGVQIGSSGTINLSGLVKFSDLSNSGSTSINGSNITSGTISGIAISGSIFSTILSRFGAMSGEIRGYYAIADDDHIAGGIKLDNQGGGTSQESAHRMFIYTRKVTMQNGSVIPFALKIESESGVSITGGDLIYIKSPQIYLDGTVYLNGTRLVP